MSYGLTCPSCRGQRTGHKHIRVLQELGTPCRFHLLIDWLKGEEPDPKLPGPKSASGLAEGRRQARGNGHRRAKETKCGGTGGRESEHFIVPSKSGNSDREDPMEERECRATVLWAGHQARALDLGSWFTKCPQIAKRQGKPVA